jgi:hypothetical protein
MDDVCKPLQCGHELLGRLRRARGQRAMWRQIKRLCTVVRVRRSRLDRVFDQGSIAVGSAPIQHER